MERDRGIGGVKVAGEKRRGLTRTIHLKRATQWERPNKRGTVLVVLQHGRPAGCRKNVIK